MQWSALHWQRNIFHYTAGARRVPSAQVAANVDQVATAERAARPNGLVHPVHARPVESEQLGLARLRQRRIAEALLQLRADLEGAQRLDLILRRAVPDGVRAPQHVVLAHETQELAEEVGGLGRVAHRLPPRRSDVRVDV